MVDFFIQNKSSLFLLRPLTAEGKDWVVEHIPDGAMFWGAAVVVEQRYIGAIIHGIQNDGLSVE